jgi:preprotein translocase subunit SecY
MSFCPNPECPYLKKIGKPAEFIEGITHCTDCSSPLSENTIIKESKAEIFFTDFHKRLIFTFALLMLFRALTHIAVPWIDFQVIIDKFANSSNELNSNSFYRISVISLGLMPYISANILVEIISLFLPPLKKWRIEGYQGRIKLKRAAIFGTLILALIQGYGVIRGLVGMFSEGVMYNSGLGSQFLFVLTLTAGTFILILLAEQITQKGIGHGISILIITGYSWELFTDFIKINNEDYTREPFEIFLIIAILSLATIILTVVIEKGCKKIPVKFSNGKEGYLPFKVTTAGIAPANLASTIIALFIFFLDYFINPNLLNITWLFYPGTISYYIVFTILTILLYSLLTRFFYNPKKIMAYLKNKNIFFIDKTEKITVNYINHYLKTIAFFGSVYLCFLILIPDILLFLFNIPIYFEGIKLLIAVAVILDLVEEIAARRKIKNLVNIAEFNDLPQAGIAKSLLESNGIPYFVKGYYHRALLYFFGPYIEISVWVPKDKSREAIELIKSD